MAGRLHAGADGRPDEFAKDLCAPGSQLTCQLPTFGSYFMAATKSGQSSGLVFPAGLGVAGADGAEFDGLSSMLGCVGCTDDAEALVNAFKANPPGGAIRPSRSVAGATWDINGVHSGGPGIGVS